MMLQDGVCAPGGDDEGDAGGEGSGGGTGGGEMASSTSTASGGEDGAHGTRTGRTVLPLKGQAALLA
ncbi:hypothetical protein WMF38_32130 [Sorangium sp. So ce118]